MTPYKDFKPVVHMNQTTTEEVMYWLSRMKGNKQVDKLLQLLQDKIEVARLSSDWV